MSIMPNEWRGEWRTEKARTSFEGAHDGEGSYYCPKCDVRSGSVWAASSWRPSKWQALCPACRGQLSTAIEEKRDE